MLSEQLENVHSAHQEREKIKQENEQLQSHTDKINQSAKDLQEKLKQFEIQNATHSQTMVDKK